MTHSKRIIHAHKKLQLYNVTRMLIALINVLNLHRFFLLILCILCILHFVKLHFGVLENREDRQNFYKYDDICFDDRKIY